MREAAPTRSTALELADERRLMRQGYEFLDEKRMLLATEMLRQLRAYQAQCNAFDENLRAAKTALAATVERHGLDHLQLYPVPAEPPPAPERSRWLFLGVPVIEVTRPAEGLNELPAAIDPSPEATACRAAFMVLLQAAAEIGARAANLHRLAREYRRTERRAKALEKVLMPEVEDAIRRVDEQLDTMEREDAVHARWWADKTEAPQGGTPA
jgi:V/A-type H+-transporting ATPase subunit D